MAKKENNRLHEVDPLTLQSWAAREEAMVVDVREPGEHAGERIPNSELVPLSRFDVAKLPESGNKTVVLYCNSGNRSAQAAERLFSAGWSEVHHLKGGIQQWRQAGLLTEGDDHAPISLERQVRIAAGVLIVAGTTLGAVVSPWWLALSGFVGAGLLFAGLTDTCGMAMLLARLPYNQRVRSR
ncbi:MAG: rhodanese-like domain-containing protein [Deltaproteobacteria bacterium]|nr:rhodanese-like domain-containing protein [Deltaproteobacteria bacterium]